MGPSRHWQYKQNNKIQSHLTDHLVEHLGVSSEGSVAKPLTADEHDALACATLLRQSFPEVTAALQQVGQEKHPEAVGYPVLEEFDPEKSRTSWPGHAGLHTSAGHIAAEGTKASTESASEVIGAMGQIPLLNECPTGLDTATV